MKADIGWPRPYSPECVELEFCELRLLGILGSSPRKFSNITHLGDAPTPIESYVANVAWEELHVKGRTATCPPSRPELRASSGG